MLKYLFFTGYGFFITSLFLPVIDFNLITSNTWNGFTMLFLTPVFAITLLMDLGGENIYPVEALLLLLVSIGNIALVASPFLFFSKYNKYLSPILFFLFLCAILISLIFKGRFYSGHYFWLLSIIITGIASFIKKRRNTS